MKVNGWLLTGVVISITVIISFISNPFGVVYLSSYFAGVIFSLWIIYSVIKFIIKKNKKKK